MSTPSEVNRPKKRNRTRRAITPDTRKWVPRACSPAKSPALKPLTLTLTPGLISRTSSPPAKLRLSRTASLPTPSIISRTGSPCKPNNAYSPFGSPALIPGLRSPQIRNPQLRSPGLRSPPLSRSPPPTGLLGSPDAELLQKHHDAPPTYSLGSWLWSIFSSGPGAKPGTESTHHTRRKSKVSRSKAMMSPKTTSQAIISPRTTSQAMMSPRATSQAMMSPRTTSQVMMSPITTSQAMMSPRTTSQAMMSPITTSQAMMSPRTTSQVMMSPRTTSQAMMSPRTTNQSEFKGSDNQKMLVSKMDLSRRKSGTDKIDELSSIKGTVMATEGQVCTKRYKDLVTHVKCFEEELVHERRHVMDGYDLNLKSIVALQNDINHLKEENKHKLNAYLNYATVLKDCSDIRKRVSDVKNKTDIGNSARYKKLRQKLGHNMSVPAGTEV